eukprot:SAG22_NODE_184_length_15968_cov_39.081858_7_plen_148_part_00
MPSSLASNAASLATISLPEIETSDSSAASFHSAISSLARSSTVSSWFMIFIWSFGFSSSTFVARLSKIWQNDVHSFSISCAYFQPVGSAVLARSSSFSPLTNASTSAPQACFSTLKFSTALRNSMASITSPLSIDDDSSVSRAALTF